MTPLWSRIGMYRKCPCKICQDLADELEKNGMLSSDDRAIDMRNSKKEIELTKNKDLVN